MNWKKIITELRRKGYTLQQIAEETGLPSRGAVHNLTTGDRQRTVVYETGVKIKAMHERAMTEATPNQPAAKARKKST